MSVNPDVIKEEILEIHYKNIDAHLNGDIDYFIENIEDSLLSVSFGDFTYKTKEELRTHYKDYLCNTEFIQYKDIQEPIFGCSQDGSVAWLIVQTRITGKQKIESDSVNYFDFICAWITLYCKKENKWIKITEVDNFKNVPLNDYSVSVPFSLDHNRMLINAEIQSRGNIWEDALLWVDSGNPDFFVSPDFANKLGVDIIAAEAKAENGKFEIDPPKGVRINGMELDFQGVRSYVVFEPFWLFSTMHNDANLPSSVLSKYRVCFDYSNSEMSIIKKGGEFNPQGISVNALIHPVTGIVQIPVKIGDTIMNFALDNGASCGFLSYRSFHYINKFYPDIPVIKGAAGCANIWGWLPGESNWQVFRIPELQLRSESFNGFAMIGLPESYPMMDWYSLKTVQKVDGILGANFLKAFNIWIDYPNSIVYFCSIENFNPNDMDLAGLTIQPGKEGNYKVIGIVRRSEIPVISNLHVGDIIIRIDDLDIKGITMGRVMDALRGNPGERHILVINRNGEILQTEVAIEHLL